MRQSFGLFLVGLVLAATPAFAGTLNDHNGQTVWSSTKCTKPATPNSFINAHPETSGDDMNALVAQHNGFVDAAQIYMNCISAEAERDQGAINQAILSGAQKAITDMQAEVDAAAMAFRGARK